MIKTLDIQDICDQCCDAGLDVNNMYIGEVFQWLENNDYQIIKKIPMKIHNLSKREIKGLRPDELTKRQIKELNHEI